MYKFILIFMVVVGINAEAFSGNDLVEKMKEQIKFAKDGTGNFGDTMLYSGYVIGVSDVLEDAGFLCIPNGVTKGQIISIVNKWILDNPKEWNKRPNQLVERPLLDAFSCSKKRK